MKYGKNFGGIDLILEAKNKQKKENVFELIVANGGYAKGKMISPLSNMQDGLFNVSYTTLAHKTSKKRYLKKVKNDEHIYDEQTKQHWMNNLKITNPEKKIKVLIDGKVQNVEELTISIIEKGLKIYKRP
jgi:diacylglycerol kinase family enzyme